MRMLTSVFALALISYAQADTTTTEEVPFVVASADRVSNLLPEPDVPLSNRGRSDVEIEQEEPFTGYFYPKPAKPFNLPEFETVNPDASIASFEGEESVEEVERSPRSPGRRPPHFRPGYIPPTSNKIPPFIPGFIPPTSNKIPPFIPGFIPPNNIRPLPALYGRGY